MTRYCTNCKSDIEYADKHCPYCAAMQENPGDPFIGFLLLHAGEIFLIVGAIIAVCTCILTFLLMALY